MMISEKEGIKLSLCTDDMILSIGNSKGTHARPGMRVGEAA